MPDEKKPQPGPEEGAITLPKDTPVTLPAEVMAAYQQQMSVVAARLESVQALLENLPDAIGRAVARSISRQQEPAGPRYPLAGGGNVAPVEFLPRGRTLVDGQEKAAPQWKESGRPPKAPPPPRKPKKDG